MADSNLSTSSPLPSTQVLCLGKNKVGKSCSCVPEQGRLFCKHHIGQEAEYLKNKEINDNPLFRLKTDVEIIELAKHYNVAYYKMSMIDTKAKILEVKPMIDRKNERLRLIRLGSSEISEKSLENDEESFSMIGIT